MARSSKQRARHRRAAGSGLSAPPRSSSEAPSAHKRRKCQWGLAAKLPTFYHSSSFATSVALPTASAHKRLANSLVLGSVRPCWPLCQDACTELFDMLGLAFNRLVPSVNPCISLDGVGRFPPTPSLYFRKAAIAGGQVTAGTGVSAAVRGANVQAEMLRRFLVKRSISRRRN